MTILRLPAVKQKTGHRSDGSVYNLIREGLFPTGILIGKRARGWPINEVEAINSARIAALPEDEIRKLVQRIHQERSNLISI